MKIKELAAIAIFVFGVSVAKATVTLNGTFGVALDSSGSTAVPDGTLWIMVVDSNDSNSFAGGFNLNSSLTDASAAGTVFANQTLTVGKVIDGDTIFAMGGFDSSTTGATGVTVASAADLSLGTNGLASNRKFAFYWFPGLSYSGVTANVGSTFQVGGIHSDVSNPSLGLEPMVIPNDTISSNPSALNVSAAGPGALSDSRFQAVQVVPEPTVALLGGLGVLALLRRRRD